MNETDHYLKEKVIGLMKDELREKKKQRSLPHLDQKPLVI